MQKKKTWDLIRWVFLGPAVCVSWCVMMIGCFIYSWSRSYYNTVLSDILFFLVCIVVPCIVEFFIAKCIAPKYKNNAGWIVVALCVLFWCLLIDFAK